MKKLIIPVFVAAAAFAFTQPTFAKDTGKPMTAQQSKFATCAHKSKGLKGDAHKKFMSDCLKGKTKAAEADKAAAKAKAAKKDAKASKTAAKTGG